MRLSVQAANIAADSVTALCDGGTLEICAETVVLATVNFAEKAFEPAQNGTAKSNRMASTNATSGGVPTLFHAKRASGEIVFTGRIPDELRVSGDIVAGLSVTVDELVYTQDKER